MKSLVSVFALAVPASLLASLPLPTLDDVARMRADSETALQREAALEPIVVDTASREAVRQLFKAVYSASEGVPMEWTGDMATGNAGDTSAAFKEAVITRVNFFRAMSGVPAEVIVNSTFSAKAQQAALMMSANNNLSHFPPSNWNFYTAEGAEAAGKSNLAIGSTGPDAIDGYMLDHGASNDVVGHRRWIFYPNTQEMGTGDIPATPGKLATNALWVQDANVFGARPATRDPYIAWPPRGHVPYQIVYPRWSFSYPGADFTSATVTMSSGGADVPVVVETRGSGSSLPDNTIVWLYGGRNGDDRSSHERPSADTTYTVSVNGVLINGSPQDFQYDVIVFDPDTTGPDTQETTITGPGTPKVGSANTYSVNVPGFAGGLRWRTVAFAPFSTVFGAENDLDGLIAKTSAGYNVRVTDLVGAGGGAYHLAQPSPPESQFLTLPDLYFIPSGASGSLTFLSRLGISTENQTARVQVSTDGGTSWTDLYTQAGNNGSEGGFTQRAVSLDPLAGRTFQLRFAYTYPGSGTFFPQTDSTVGWVIDNITLTGAQTASVQQLSSYQAGSTFDFTPTTAGAIGLQASGVLFGTFPLEWGPVLVVNAADNPPPGGGGRIINLSVRSNAGSGDRTLIAGFVVGGSGSGSVLLRGIGPTLGDLGVAGAMPDPQLNLIQNQVVIASNDNWGDSASLSDLFTTLGAFDLTAGSLDAAMVQSLNIGAYEGHVVTTGTEGIALVEAYDAESGGGTARFVNLSARTQVGTGNDILIAGFVVGGSGSATLLIRAIGPTLGDFGVQGALADPVLALFLGDGTKIDENDDWGGSSLLADTFASIGAFDLPSASKDAVLLVSVNPGAYTAQVSGAGATTGIALVEIYEVVQP